MAANAPAPPPPPAAPVAYTPPPPPPPPAPAAHPETLVASASWYGPGFNGHKTATGERFSSAKMTAAAKGLPLGSRVVVTNLDNGRSATVRINDCGPYHEKRKLDLSKKAASKIGIIHDGTAKVQVEVVQKPAGTPVCPPSI
jgi:rare lipoprotein A